MTPDAFHPEIFCRLSKKREARKKGKMEKKRRKTVKGKEEKSFFVLFVCFVLFLKPLKLVWGLPKWKFLPGKSIKSRREKRIPPLKNIYFFYIPLTALFMR